MIMFQPTKEFCDKCKRDKEKELLDNEIKFLTWIYSVIGDDSIDYMLKINDRIEKLKLRQKQNGN